MVGIASHCVGMNFVLLVLSWIECEVVGMWQGLLAS